MSLVPKSSRPIQMPDFWAAADQRQARGGWRWLALLWPVSVLYRGLLWARKWYFCIFARAQPLPCPTLVVGNIYIGGTGKTPLVIALVKALRAKGWTPGVISRGYGRVGQEPDVPRLLSTQDRPEQVGDEALLIHLHAAVPVVVCRARQAAARALLRHHPEVDVILSDDGLQHYALWRDLEIALYDARGLGNGQVLPAGPLRESPRRAVDYNLLHLPVGSKADIKLKPAAIPLWGAIAPPYRLADFLSGALSQDASSWSAFLAQVKGKRLIACAGIGHPERFFTALRTQGVNLTECLALPDHFVFSAHFFARFRPSDTLLMTEKDAVKCFGQWGSHRALAGPQIWVVPYAVSLDPAWFAQLSDRLSASKNLRGASPSFSS